MTLSSSSSSPTPSFSFSLSEQGNQTQVMNEVDTRASGSSCGDGGGTEGGGADKKWRN